MKILKLYIEDYKKFSNETVNFNTKQSEEYFKDIYGDINITALIGANGTGKTTILSMIAIIFRYLQRNQYLIPSNFELLYEINNNEILIEKKRKNIFVKINDNSKKLLLEMKRINKQNVYSRNTSQVGIQCEDTTYDELKPYLPTKIIVSGFDNEYNLEYNFNLICDRLVTSYNSIYLNSLYGKELSLGILRFYIQYFLGNKAFKETFDCIDIYFSDYVAIRYTPPIKKEIGNNKYNINGYILENNEFNNIIDDSLIDELKKLLIKYDIIDTNKTIISILDDAYFDKYCDGMLEDEFNQRFNINKYLLSNDYNRELLEILINHNVLYINDIFIKNDTEYRMERMSTGEKMILGRLFFILNNLEDNTIIILEEPEVHLNYLWVKHIISILIILLKSYSVHLIISSHHYSFINNLYPEQILLLNKEGILKPENNTLLADEEVILNMVSGNRRSDNYIENLIFDIINKGNIEKIKYYFDNLGESYIKVLLFKKLVEMGEIDVENNK